MDIIEEVTYTYNNILYKIVGSQELHNQLQIDQAFFEEYVQGNAAALEIENPDVSEIEDDSWTWSKKNTLLFLDILKKKSNDLRNTKIKKKNIWRDIKEEISQHTSININEAIIERKFRNMKATFKTIKDNKKKTSTGRGAVKWEYYEAMDDIFKDDKSINVGHTISSFPDVYSPLPTTSGLAVFGNPDIATLPSSSGLQVSSSPTTLPGTSSQPDVETVGKTPLTPLTPLSLNVNKTPKTTVKSLKTERGKQLYGLRKKQIEVEESRVNALLILTKSIDESNRIQAERNNLFKSYLEKQ